MSEAGPATPIVDPGSFRDPAGRVCHHGGRVFRTLSPSAAARIDVLSDSGALQRLVASGLLWPAERVADPALADRLRSATGSMCAGVLEHPPLPFVSYPYEWPFALLKRAALAHLDLHRAALDLDCTLVDGSAYNVQFVGTRPVFIDTLSVVPYRVGDYWLGYRQFCEQFLNPLLLTAACGVPFQPWFRGSQEGIGVREMARLLPWSHAWRWGAFAHVTLHAAALQSATRGVSARAPSRPMSKRWLVGLLSGLRRMIAGLRSRPQHSTWRNYSVCNSYDDAETAAKRAFIAEFVASARPHSLWDLGCNSGDYSAIALQAGAHHVIGFDFDLGALDAAVERAERMRMDMLPLWLDAANPSPAQGWLQRERAGLRERASASAVLALAFVHHLAIGRNLPLADVIEWIVGIAPTGVVEFVPKSDPMVQRMLSAREDIFDDYNVASFVAALEGRAAIVAMRELSPGGRRLYRYERTRS